MPNYTSTDPNAAQITQPKKYTSTDPNAADVSNSGSSGNHPFLAGLARLAGGVGSALMSPADVTVLGSTIPAAIAGGSESLAEWLEGSEQSPARIGTEAAIGAIPFAKMVKEGGVLANMGKAALHGAVGEGAREKARGDDLNPMQIAGSGALSGATYGLFHRFLGAGRTHKVAPAEPFEVVPTTQTGEGTSTIAKAGKGKNGKIVRSGPISAPAPIKPSGENISVAGGPVEPDVKAAIPGTTDVTAYGGPAAKSQLRDQKRFEQLQKILDRQNAAKRIQQERIDAGLEPKTSFSESESGVDEAGKQVRKSTRFAPPKEEGGDVDPTDLESLVQTAEQKIAAGNRVNLEPVTETPAGPVSKLAQVLRPRRSLKSVEGFNSALNKRIEQGGLPGDPPVGPQVPQDAPGAVNAAGGDVPPTPAPSVAPEPIMGPGEPNGAPPETALAKFFKTKQGATGYNYRAAKDAAKAGEIPTADFARDSHLIELGKSPEGPLAGMGGEPQALPITGGTVETPQGDPNAPDWVQQELDRVQKLKDLTAGTGADPSGETKLHGGLGGILPDKETLQKYPALTRMLAGLTGAAVGAPVGSYLNPDDPNASIKGALAGGALGYAGAKGPQELINWRNAGLLATPSAQMKKPLSDFGAYVGKAAESALSGKFQSETAPMMREMFNPVNLSNYARAFKDPRLAEDVIGDTAKPYIEPAKGLMGIVARPFAAAQYATSQAMQRAGVSPETAKDTLLLGNPKAELFRKWLDLQKLPGWQGQAVRAVRPFARIGTNLFERGWERIPGISMMTGDPETRVARTILGTGALAAGALTGHGDEQDLEQGGYEVSPIVRGLRRALLASYGIPFMAGEALAGPAGMRDLAYMVPGLSQTVPMPGPKDDAMAWGGKIGKRWLDQMMPDWLMPADWQATPQR